jgi:PPOX class probable F420-dependent enzyme
LEKEPSMTLLTDEVREAIEAGNLAHLVTLNPDGSPQLSVVWVGIENDEIVAGHLFEHQKVRNVRGDPRVVLSIETGGQDERGFEKYLVVHGTARITEGGAPALLQRLVEEYVGPGVKFPPMDNPPEGYITRNHDRPPRRRRTLGFLTVAALRYTHDAGIARLVIANPLQNRLDDAVLERLAAAVEDLQSRDDTRAIVLTADGPDFSWGFARGPTEASPPQIDSCPRWPARRCSARTPRGASPAPSERCATADPDPPTPLKAASCTHLSTAHSQTRTTPPNRKRDRPCDQISSPPRTARSPGPRP